jgi:hypothetical protein
MGIPIDPNETRQARLEAFLSHLEVLTTAVDPLKPATKAGVEAEAASLDDLMPGTARDLAALLTTIAALPATPDTLSSFATEADAKQAVEHLFGAMEALDRAGTEIRSFIRLTEPLLKHLARLSTEGEQQFTESLTTIVERSKANGRPGKDVKPNINSIELAPLCEALTPYWYSPGRQPADRDARHSKPPLAPTTIKPDVCIKSMIRLRNLVTHQHLPPGARLVPYFQTALAGLACLITPEGRIGKVHRHLSKRGMAPFLVTEYLSRLQTTCRHRVPTFIERIITESNFVPRRLTRAYRHPGDLYARPLNQAEPAPVRPTGLPGLLETHQRVWLHAEGGCGKSELMRAAARDMAQNSHQRLLPVFIPLNGYQAGTDHANLVGLVKRSLGLRQGAPMPRLHQWTPVLLLDGYNEIDRSSQMALLRELSDFDAEWDHHKVCISSRTAAPHGGEWVTTELLQLDESDIKGFLAAIRRNGVGLDLEAFWRSAETRPYWQLALKNPLFMTLCAAYALQTADASLPASEAQIFKRLVDDYYQREVEKTPDTAEDVMRATRSVLREMAWATYAHDTMALHDADARAIAEGQLTGRVADPLATLLGVGLVERDGGEVRFILEPLRDYLVAEQLLEEMRAPQEVEDDEVPDDPLARIAGKIEASTIELAERLPQERRKPRHLKVFEHLGTDDLDQETEEREWLKERLQSGAKIFQYVAEQASTIQRRLYCKSLVRHPINLHRDSFGGGFFFYLLEAAAKLSHAFPQENLLSADEFVALYLRASAFGLHYGDFALYAISACKMAGLAERIAEVIEVAPGVSLAEFPGSLRNKRRLKQLAHAMTFRGYPFYELWRLDPAWAEAKIPDLLRFMVESGKASDEKQVIFLLQRYKTEEFLKQFRANPRGSLIRSEPVPAPQTWQEVVKGWCWWDGVPPQTPAIALVLILQERPALIPLLGELAPLEAGNSAQILSMIELLSTQHTNEYDESTALFATYAGNHLFMAARNGIPTNWLDEPDEIGQALQVAAKTWPDDDYPGIFGDMF